VIVQEAKEIVQPKKSAMWSKEWEEECIKIHEASLEKVIEEKEEHQQSLVSIKPVAYVKGAKTEVCGVPFNLLKDDNKEDFTEASSIGAADGEEATDSAPKEFTKRRPSMSRRPSIGRKQSNRSIGRRPSLGKTLRSVSRGRACSGSDDDSDCEVVRDATVAEVMLEGEAKETKKKTKTQTLKPVPVSTPLCRRRSRSTSRKKIHDVSFDDDEEPMQRKRKTEPGTDDDGDDDDHDKVLSRPRSRSRTKHAEKSKSGRRNHDPEFTESSELTSRGNSKSRPRSAEAASTSRGRSKSKPRSAAEVASTSRSKSNRCATMDGGGGGGGVDSGSGTSGTGRRIRRMSSMDGGEGKPQPTTVIKRRISARDFEAAQAAKREGEGSSFKRIAEQVLFTSDELDDSTAPPQPPLKTPRDSNKLLLHLQSLEGCCDSSASANKNTPSSSKMKRMVPMVPTNSQGGRLGSSQTTVTSSCTATTASSSSSEYDDGSLMSDHEPIQQKASCSLKRPSTTKQNSILRNSTFTR